MEIRNRYVGGQSSRFVGVVADVAACKPPVWKIIDPDSDVLRDLKIASPNTKTIVRIYTGVPNVDNYTLYPDAKQYGKDYAARVYFLLKDPHHTDYLEMENEPNDHYGDLTRFIGRLNDFILGFCERLAELNQQFGTNVKPIGPNFSVGYPEVFVPGTDYEVWPNAWQGLVSGLRAIKAAGGALGLHEYGAPGILEGFRDNPDSHSREPYLAWSDAKQMGYLVGRINAVYKVLPPDLSDPVSGLPAYLTEYGIDYILNGVEGGFWHNRDEFAYIWFIQQLRLAWDKVYKNVPLLRGACIFVHGTIDPSWEEYDTTRTTSSRDAIVAFMAETLPVSLPPPTGGIVYPDSYFLTGILALARKAHELNLGSPLTGEDYVYDGQKATHVRQLFQGGLLVVEIGKWDKIELRDPVDGKLLDKSKPYGFGGTGGSGGGSTGGFKFPAALTSVGAMGEAGVPVPGMPFYRLTGGTVRTSISAFMVVTVFSRGVPKIGAKVVNLFPDGNGEVIETDGSGNAHFQFGASSAFTNPGDGPFTVFVADDSAFKDSESVPKRVVYQYRLSDVVKSLGDFRGEHTEIYMQFVEDDGEVLP